MGQQRTVQTFAAEHGRSVDEVLAACQRGGVVAWSGFTPLDDKEASAIEAALTPLTELPPPPPPGGLGHLPPPLPPADGPLWPAQPSTSGPSVGRILGTIGAVVGLIVVVCVAAVTLLGGKEERRFDAIDPATFSDVDQGAASCVDLMVASVNNLDLASIDVQRRPRRCRTG